MTARGWTADLIWQEADIDEPYDYDLELEESA